MFVCFLITFFLCFFVNYKLLIGMLHIFQMGRYTLAHLHAWIDENFSVWSRKLFLFVVIPFAITSLINYLFVNFVSVKLLLSLSLILYVIFWCEKPFGVKKNYKTPLKFTPRILRFCAVYFLVFAISSFTLFQTVWTRNVYFYNTIFLQPILIFMCFYVTVLFCYLMEFLISEVYILLAKDKLKKHTNLLKIAITGSFAKTSIKNILSTVLSEKYNVLTTPKSYNTPMGIVITVREFLNNNHEVFIIEMGADKVGDIKFLCKLTKPNFGIISGVAKQHLQTFGSVENIVKTKYELAENLHGNNRFMVFNLDNEHTSKMFSKYSESKCGVTLFDDMETLNNSHVFFAKNAVMNEEGSSFEVFKNNELYLKLKTTLLGKHNILNILFAIAVAHKLGMSKKEIEVGVKKIKQIPHRMESKLLKNYALLIDNSYNANPVSVDCSLDVLSLMNRKNKTVITPGLIELKDESYTENYIFGKKIAFIADRLVIVNNINKKALFNGAIAGGMKKDQIVFFDCFSPKVFNYLNSLGKDDVVLIENDLPDYYS